jgi:hypothetical protein
MGGSGRGGGRRPERLISGAGLPPMPGRALLLNADPVCSSLRQFRVHRAFLTSL